MWLWISRKGALLDANTDRREFGYAGRGSGRNNPDWQHVKSIGPIPEGLYTIQAPHDSEVTGPYTLTLVPDESNTMFGRSSFAMHGDSIKEPGTASHGCIVVSRKTRTEVWESGDHRLRVVAP